MRAAVVVIALAAPAAADVPPTPAELAQRIEQLEQDAAERDAKVAETIVRLGEQKQRALAAANLVHVYADIGWFVAAGDGSGIRSDIGHRFVGDHDDVPAEWVFLGDSLSTAINTQGEPADLGPARAFRDDTVDSGGRPTFIVNALALDLSRRLADKVALAALVQLMPRPHGAQFSVERAWVEYQPRAGTDLVLKAGKIESVLGLEYREQDAPERLTVTPSLICRYTCGRPYGLRAELRRGAIDASATLTNGDAFAERFEPDDHLASTNLPTLSAHLRWTLPFARKPSIGASAALGPQDNQPDREVGQWHYGFDVQWSPTPDLELIAEFVHGRQPGETSAMARAAEVTPDAIVAGHCDLVPCRHYKGAYALASWHATPRVRAYARGDWRDARHQDGIEFLYVSRVLRGTVGAKIDALPHVIVKLEYSRNYELLGPQFPNDVITGSVVVSTR